MSEDRVRKEAHWPASLALLVCAGLYVALPSRLDVGPQWLLPALIILPLVPLSARRHRHPDESRWVRTVCVSLIGIITLANVASVVLLCTVFYYATNLHARALITSAASIWATNVIVFGLWFWEIDRGGPHRARRPVRRRGPTCSSPRWETRRSHRIDWRPSFIDYLYTSFANGTSFAPADAMPLSLHEELFASEALISFVTIAVVAGGRVNILR